MKLLLLGGQSILNKSWVEEIKKKLEGDFDQIEIIDYEHWKTNTEEADVDKEIEKVFQVTKDWSDYLIFAKSIGSIITLKASFENKIAPKYAVLVGVPYQHAQEKGLEIDKWLDTVKFPVHAYQKEVDPFGRFDYTKKFVTRENIVVDLYECIDEPNNDHHYANLDTIKKIILSN